MRIAEHFARLQVAELWLVDPRCCKPESLLTHPISRVTRLPKARYTARVCKEINPATRVFYFAGSVEELPPDAFASAHLCIMATDNLAAEIEVGRRCVSLGKRLVQASLHGETLTAQVRVFGNADAEGPCPACAFGAIEWQQLAEQVRYSCEASQAGVRSRLQMTSLPTRSTSHLCSLGADLAVNQSLRLALHLGEPVANTILEYCGFTNRIVTSRIERNPTCRCDHTRFEVVRAAMPLREYSLTKLLETFFEHEAAELITVTLGRWEWIEQARCRCADPVSVGRFVVAGRSSIGRCRRCMRTIRAQPFGTCQTITVALLGNAASVSLAKLGVRECPWILLRGAEKGILVQDPLRQSPTS
jgi:molybdopterin/thiamine biosynthesis adenylyltransferase